MEKSTPSSEYHVIDNEGPAFEDGVNQAFQISCDDHDGGMQLLHPVDEHANGGQTFDIDGNGHETDGDPFFEMEGKQGHYGVSILKAGGEDCAQQPELRSNGHDDSNGQLIQLANDAHMSCQVTSADAECSASREIYCRAPVVGMEFETYDDAYNYYNFYAKELGFAVRIKSSWTKRNSKEKRGAVLCCNCEGFKTLKEASNRRKDTRTGCLAMIRLRLVESNRWRVDEVKLEHNHLFDPERAQNSKAQKKIEAGAKRKVETAVDVEVRTIKLYRTPVIDVTGSRSVDSNGNNNRSCGDTRHLKLHNSDLEAIHDFFSRAQLMNPNFVYLMDMNDEGQLRNIFWIGSRSRAAYSYFGDVVAVDTTCLSKNCAFLLLTVTGINHHGQSILMGCGLLADETVETYIWLLRSWLTCILGRPPQTIVTDQSKAMQSAITEVFPRTRHRIHMSNVIQGMIQKLDLPQACAEFGSLLYRTIYEPLKVDEFEVAWENMTQHFGIRDHEWFRSLYDDRERWAPVYLKDTYLAGLFATNAVGSSSFIFDGYIHEHTSIKEFLDIYETALKEKQVKEALDDLESRDLNPLLRTGCSYERQLADIYTKEIFEKFQREIEMISSCVSMSLVYDGGNFITYMIKDHIEGSEAEVRNFEVTYDKSTGEVRCLCGCFNLNGYLCRHALSVLNYNGMEEIPAPYILSRWRKDCKRMYVPVVGSNTVDITNPVQWYDHLYRRAIAIVEEGLISQDHYMAAWEAFKESLNKVRLTAVAQAGSAVLEECNDGIGSAVIDRMS